MHAPQTLEGWQVWDLVQRLGGQVRVVAGASGGAVTGWDVSAALQLGAALGVAPRVIAELLPPIEAVMVRKVNEQIGSGSREGFNP
jgi:isopentenyl diphosphate isomerase/L-lactate dehydrogenase-like FMN-dependent dehydrogenase